MMRRHTLLALLAAAGPAAAADRPPTLPTHDVTVTYRLEGAASQIFPYVRTTRLRVAWSATLQRLRASPDSGGDTGPDYALVDLRTGTATLVDNVLHTAFALPVRPRDLDPIRLQDTRLEPRGDSVVARRPCTEYAVTARRGSGTICLGTDGLVLRGTGTVDGRQGSFVALAVDDSPVSQAELAAPPNVLPLTLPRLRLPQ